MLLNKIIQGDNIKLIKQIPDNSIDLTVTSPPYDNLRSYNDYSWDFEELSKELYRVTKSGGVIVWVVGDETINGGESGSSFRQALHFQSLGLLIHDTMIFQKHNFSNPSSTRYHQIFEYMFVFSKGKPKTFNPIMDRPNINAGNIGSWGRNTVTQKDGSKVERERKINKEFGMRYNIWKYQTGKEKNSKYHPAVFPLQLAKDHILSWSNEGDTVLDPFIGSGTTALACISTKRYFIGFEISKEYCDVADRLISEYVAVKTKECII